MTYEGGTALRSRVDKRAGTYTSSEEPDCFTIQPHNEMSMVDIFPSKVGIPEPAFPWAAPGAQIYDCWLITFGLRQPQSAVFVTCYEVFYFPQRKKTKTPSTCPDSGLRSWR